ncbi:histidine kinase dimerization/phospho-acceptor domain-containing protein [Hymenobacter humi]|uniref:histidine kinase n=1 Tax=Hymenobacter humi TaxID=1411620 RepID=A0ABW2U2L9_9BACT
MCYGLEITTQRQAEARSRESEEQVLAQQTFTNLVLDLNPNLIWVRDAQGNTVFENARMKAARANIQEQAGTATMEAALHVEELKAAALADQEVLATGQQITSITSVKLKNGEERWYQTVRCPLVLAGGQTQVLGVSTDITALKAAQQEAEASASARENFLANMSHEIRTPLNGVLGMTSLLAKTGLNDQQRNYTAVIQHSGRHLLNVVNDVLDMAKITSGKLEPGPVGLQPVRLHGPGGRAPGDAGAGKRHPGGGHAPARFLPAALGAGRLLPAQPDFD